MRDCPVAKASDAKRLDLVWSDPGGGPADPLAECSRPVEARPDAVGDQRPLELPDGSHHVKDQLACRGRGVDVLLDRDEGHAAASEMLESFDQLLDGAGRTIKALDDDGVKLASGCVSEQPAKFGAILLGARSDVSVGSDQSPAALNNLLTDLSQLDFQVLAIGADPAVCGDLHLDAPRTGGAEVPMSGNPYDSADLAYYRRVRVPLGNRTRVGLSGDLASTSQGPCSILDIQPPQPEKPRA